MGGVRLTTTTTTTTTTTPTTTTTTTTTTDGPPLLLLEGWEANAWRALGKEMEMLKARLDIVSQAYTQVVAMRESLTANEMARQVGLLPSLAALFIPVSFVAAVFSMGGAFAAGETLFGCIGSSPCPCWLPSLAVFFCLRHRED